MISVVESDDSGGQLSFEELEIIRTRLREDVFRLRHELDAADVGQVETDTGGQDEADLGAQNVDISEEESLAGHSRSMLEVTEHALQRVDEGSYGTCEACSASIDKQRLIAFPRATLCMTCQTAREQR